MFIVKLFLLFFLLKLSSSADFFCHRTSHTSIMCSLPRKSLKRPHNSRSIIWFKNFSHDQLRKMTEVDFVEFEAGDFMPSRIGQIFPRLTKLTFRQSTVWHVLRRNFNYMPQLEEICLNFNPISDLHQDIFYNLPNLRHIDLKNNQISELLPDLLFHARKLKFFDASNNRILHIDAGFFKTNEQLEIVKLSGNLINRIDVDFSFFEGLKVVDVTSNLGECNFDVFVDEREGRSEKLMKRLDFQRNIDDFCRFEDY